MCVHVDVKDIDSDLKRTSKGTTEDVQEPLGVSLLDLCKEESPRLRGVNYLAHALDFARNQCSRRFFRMG